MDKNAIKKYAVWARRELISRVSQKAMQYGITDVDIVSASATSVNGMVLSAEEMSQRKALIIQLEAKGYEQVMEEVAYTWFNRFIALRFMEVNGYLPSRVRVFTDENNAFKPQVLSEAINLELDGLDMDKVYALKEANNDDALFKYLVITQCNALNSILPGMFQRISDYTELLFPDNLLREGSAIEQMISMIPEDDWKDAVQIIGWLYQYYNSEKKDEVFAALKKNVKITKENIPAATQLFTPDWIVRYMVENSLGRLWVEGHPNDDLRAEWKYYLDEAEQEPAVQTQLTAIRKGYSAITPEQIKCIDPCAGSGHILAYMFDVLVQIYEAYGYTAREAVHSIVENNIYGLDIDDRAAQLAYFAVMMKARQYDRRFLTRKDGDGNPDVPQPYIHAIVESNDIDSYALDYFVNGDPNLKAAMGSIVREMQDAKEYGSILNITPVDFDALNARLDEVRNDINLSRETVLTEILPLVQVARILTLKFDVVVTNPPYMGNGSMNDKLCSYAKNNYPNSKLDLFAMMMEACGSFTRINGYYALITMHSWMFLGSFESLREKLLRTRLVNLLHLGSHTFDNDVGTIVQNAAFVFNKTSLPDTQAVFVRLVDYGSSSEKRIAFSKDEHRFTKTTDHFLSVPGTPMAYWVSKKIIDVFKSADPLSKYGDSRSGLQTSDNKRFLRLWFEVDNTTIGLGYSNAQAAERSKKKWFPHTKGGAYRKWYGNLYYVVNWENDGAEIKQFATDLYKSYSRIVKNTEYYFEEGITWSHTATKNHFGVRYVPPGVIFNVEAPTFFRCNNWEYMLGLLNSNVAATILPIMNQTMHFLAGDTAKFPVVLAPEHYLEIKELVHANISLAKDDWNLHETSWDFQGHPLVAGNHRLLERAVFELKTMLDERKKQLMKNERQLNKLFIDSYGFTDEGIAEIDEEDITVTSFDLKQSIKSLISYAVGCMFGRYSIDVPGVVYAGGEWNASNYVTFPADQDSIIPICDDEYFEDDVVGRFTRFVEVVYGKETLDENLRFIADALGGNGQPKDVIRNYFLNDFYADHCDMYSVTGSGKRPIYWLFDSGKKGGFRALVYMHRYQPDTIARMRTDYVHEQQARYRTAIADLEQRIASASTSERVKLSKRLKILQEQATEIQGYEEKIHHLADQYIAIDLDDGVKKNYEIFKDVLAKIK